MIDNEFIEIDEVIAEYLSKERGYDPYNYLGVHLREMLLDDARALWRQRRGQPTRLSPSEY
jgi:hypothetical protein